MMGSAPPPVSAQVQTLSLLLELIEAFRDGPADIKVQIKTLRDLHKSVAAEMAKLDKTKAEQATLLETNTKAGEDLAAREAAMAAKIAACDEREIKLNAFNKDLTSRQELIVKNEQDLNTRKQTADADSAKKLKQAEQEIITKIGIAEREMKAKQVAADLEIKQKQEETTRALAAQKAELAQQEAKIKASQTELRSRTEQLRAVLPSFNGA